MFIHLLESIAVGVARQKHSNPKPAVMSISCEYMCTKYVAISTSSLMTHKKCHTKCFTKMCLSVKTVSTIVLHTFFEQEEATRVESI